jgi:hypothetical protein
MPEIMAATRGIANQVNEITLAETRAQLARPIIQPPSALLRQVFSPLLDLPAPPPDA